MDRVKSPGLEESGTLKPSLISPTYINHITMDFYYLICKVTGSYVITFPAVMADVSISLANMSPNDIVWDLRIIIIEVFSEQVVEYLQCPVLSGMGFIKNFPGAPN